MRLEELMFRPGLMSGHSVVVTGGGTGLGKEMAEALLVLGARVAIAGRREEVLRETADALMAAHGGEVLPVACDIRDADSIALMADRVWDAFGSPTGLINNAAGNFISRTEDLSPRGFDAIANIVFRGSFLTTLEFGKRWIAGGNSASVVSIVTTWVWNGSPFVVPSAMSKAGIAAMTQSLAVEWGGKGIRFNAIAPGPFPTEGMTKRLKPNEGGAAYADMSQNPLGRVGRMPELANLATFLLHPGAEYVNGQVIAIDGGDYQATGGNFAALRSWSDEQWSQARQSIKAAAETEKAGRS
ncbi:SDR family oxidoreductase [Sphingobium indicum]|uniref:SDR family oxidoreductase n=1 Tax=Sphingobium indicum TaxID=332055 RepID=A0A4Q4J653_9SPHN|nr:SDR family oxidoreductase [Sphingobium indicum]NYI23663.1 NAD(P)-dependent dehydrogenase (short-subunit alcohol dehydrogenase family) [Sphingobium indicum]RYM01495.1 SDR family oxidoreductase [Sphingobium indicum]